MSNPPILPMVPGGAIVGSPATPDDEPIDDQEAVDQDARDASAVNDKLQK